MKNKIAILGFMAMCFVSSSVLSSTTARARGDSDVGWHEDQSKTVLVIGNDVDRTHLFKVQDMEPCEVLVLDIPKREYEVIPVIGKVINKPIAQLIGTNRSLYDDRLKFC